MFRTVLSNGPSNVSVQLHVIRLVINYLKFTSLLLAFFFSSSSAFAFAGWSACNLGIFVGNKASDAAVAKAQQLWPDEPPGRFWVSRDAGDSYDDGIRTNYWHPQTGFKGALWGGNFSPSWVACKVSSCPSGHDNLDGACVPQCKVDEVRNAAGICECIAGKACAADNSGPPSCSGGGVSVGNPINAATGNKYEVETDYINKSNPLLRIERTYNSNSNARGLFGSSWSFEYETRVGFLPPATIPAIAPSMLRVTRANGNVHRYIRSADVWNSSSTVRDSVNGWGDNGWRVVRPSGITEIYNKDGTLVQVTDRTGHRVSFVYASNGFLYPGLGLLQKITDGVGQSLTFTYNTQKRITSITSSDGKVFTYAYDANSNLVSVNLSNSGTRLYHYNESAHTGGANLPNALTGITDERGVRYATWKYDTQGRAISSEHAGGTDKTLLAFNTDGSTTVTNALGKQTTYNFSVINNVPRVVAVEGHATTSCEGANQNYTYTPEGWLASKTDWKGNATTYSYNTFGQEISRTEAFGTPQARTITTEWHPDFYVKTRLVEGGKETLYTYDDSGRLLSTTTNPLPIQ